jgi:hypothetical protein
VCITEDPLQWKSSGSGSRKPRLTTVGIRCADQITPSNLQKVALTSPTSAGRSVSIVRLRTKVTEFSFSLLYKSHTGRFKCFKFKHTSGLQSLVQAFFIPLQLTHSLLLSWCICNFGSSLVSSFLNFRNLKFNYPPRKL